LITKLSCDFYVRTLTARHGEAELSNKKNNFSFTDESFFADMFMENMF
jgi:hypothetical protein